MTRRKRKGTAAEVGGKTDAGTTRAVQEPTTTESRGYLVAMRPRAVVLWLSLLWWRRNAHLRSLAPGRNYTDDQLPAGLKAIEHLAVAIDCRPKRETRGADRAGAAPDFEEWADRMVGAGVVDEDLVGILPAWMRAEGRIEAVVDLAPSEWETILSETVAPLDRMADVDRDELWSFLSVRNCELGTYDGHIVLFEELLGEILRALREASPRNAVAFDAWASGSPPRLPFPLWGDVALLAWVRGLADDP